jgi:hypothetical protein
MFWDGGIDMNREEDKDAIIASYFDRQEKMVAEITMLRNAEDRAYQMLEFFGVPKERAKTIANGIDVLSNRYNKAFKSLSMEIGDCKKHNGEMSADYREDFDKQNAEIERLREIPKKVVAVFDKYASYDAHSHDPQNNAVIYVTEELRAEIKSLLEDSNGAM